MIYTNRIFEGIWANDKRSGTGYERYINGNVIKENLQIIRLMEKEFTLGKTEKFMMVNGKMERRMAMAFGEAYTVIAIQESGKTARLKAMESISGKMGINMKVNGSIA